MKRKLSEKVILRYLEGRCTPEEKRMVETSFLRYLQQPGNVPSAADIHRVSQEMQQGMADFLYKDTHILSTHTRTGRLVRFRWLAGAAAVFLLVIFTLLLSKPTVFRSEPEQTNLADVEAGTNKAVLTMSDGRTILLDSDQQGIVMDSDAITYADGSVLGGTAQNGIGSVPDDREQELLLTTPKGGQYQVVLPDGTKVWLNAQSTLKYPSRFIEDKREVFLEGEAYFEVKADQPASQPKEGHRAYTRPFIVKSRNQEVIVLGTRFNISTYADEPEVTTTLVSGAVKVRLLADTDEQSQILRAGEQAVAGTAGLTVRTADLQAAVAWKNGYFVFNNTDLRTIMRQVARWYDIKVDYQNISHQTFSAEIPRSARLSTLLKVIELNSNISFQVVSASGNKEERRLVIR